MQSLSDLLSTWREQAATLRQFGDGRVAGVVELMAAQVEEAVSRAGDEALTIPAAAEESGYSTRRLREFIAEGKVPNAGERGRPRILRRDLPTKRGPQASRAGGYDPASDARSILSRRAGGQA